MKEEEPKNEDDLRASLSYSCNQFTSAKTSQPTMKNNLEMNFSSHGFTLIC